LEDKTKLKRIEFNLKNFGVLTDAIGWCNVYCPYCSLYHSHSFLFEPVNNQKEYIGKCEKCGEKAVIDMGTIEQNNKMAAIFKQNNLRLKAGGNATIGEFIEK